METLTYIRLCNLLYGMSIYTISQHILDSRNFNHYAIKSCEIIIFIISVMDVCQSKWGLFLLDISSSKIYVKFQRYTRLYMYIKR